MSLRSILFAVGFLLPPSAVAEETQPQSEEELTSLQSFASAHPECAEWNDGCSTCRREAGLRCSTPGIACEPHEIVCKTP